MTNVQIKIMLLTFVEFSCSKICKKTTKTLDNRGKPSMLLTKASDKLSVVKKKVDSRLQTTGQGMQLTYSKSK